MKRIKLIVLLNFKSVPSDAFFLFRGIEATHQFLMTTNNLLSRKMCISDFWYSDYTTKIIRYLNPTYALSQMSLELIDC